MFAKSLVTSIILMALASCGGMDEVTVENSPSEPRKIEVVHREETQKPYEIIGEFSGNPAIQDVEDWKKKAAMMGADAVSIPKDMPDQYVKLYAIRWK